MFNAMKQSAKMFVLLILLNMVMLSCDSPDTVQPSRVIDFDREVNFSSTVMFWSQPIVYNDEFSKDVIRTELITSGISITKNLYKFQLEMSHITYLTEFGNSVNIEDGKIEIIGDGNDQISGTYTGFGSLTDDKRSIDYLIKIDGGTGHFTNAEGYLHGTSILQETNQDVRKLELEGTIVRNDNVM